jgi:single-strand DNA-binding protein
MANFNKVLLMGNLTRDPELRYTPKGTAITTITLAVNRTWSSESGEKKEEVTFVDVDVWGKQAETIGQYMAKGRPLFVEGRLKLDQWDDKETGQKRSRLKVVCENFQFIGAPKGGGGGGEFSEQPPAAGKPSRPRPAATPAAAEEAPAGEGDDNIPF